MADVVGEDFSLFNLLFIRDVTKKCQACKDKYIRLVYVYKELVDFRFGE